MMYRQISIMCHPNRIPKIPLVSEDAYYNYMPNYADATRYAIRTAIENDCDLIICDSDGYHTEKAINYLTWYPYVTPSDKYIILPYRSNIGIQSHIYSIMYSFIHGTWIRDVTGGLYRLSLELMKRLPELKSEDMTIHIEMINAIRRLNADIIQYPYKAGINETANSNRTKHYQLKLLRKL